MDTELTVEEYTQVILKGQESSTTSPSGRHLGIYRATFSKLDLEFLRHTSKVVLVPSCLAQVREVEPRWLSDCQLIPFFCNLLQRYL